MTVWSCPGLVWLHQRWSGVVAYVGLLYSSRYKLQTESRYLQHLGKRFLAQEEVIKSKLRLYN